MKIFASAIWGENHQFNTVLATGSSIQVLRGEAIKEQHQTGATMWGALFEAAQQYDWEFVYPLEAFCGANTGPVEQLCFDALAAEFFEELEAALPVDGVILPLHGSLISENNPDTEGYLLEGIRQRVGDSAPIAIGLDLHANVTQKMIDHCNILTAFRTTPHIDQYETGKRAADLLQRTLTGDINPQLVMTRLPMLDALDRGRTIDCSSPLPKLLKEVERIESDDTNGLLDIALHAGYAWQDSAEAGPSVVVTYDAQNRRAKGKAEQTADHFIQKIWETKDYRSVELLSIEDTIAMAKAVPAGAKPLLIGEYTDNPGAGGYGDCTHLLKAMLEADLSNAVFFSIADAAAAEQGIKAGEGLVVTLTVGGKKDQRFSGEPLTVTGTVKAISDGQYLRKGPFAHGTIGTMGPSLCLGVGGLDIIITSIPTMTDDREQLRVLGITPERKSILACKAMNHFRADYEPICSQLIYVDAKGICSLDYSIFPYKNLPRPIWPLDNMPA